jgi:hypothetical protein
MGCDVARKAEAEAHLHTEDLKNYQATHMCRSVSGKIDVYERSRV